jgi:hypothetical protein
MTEKSSYDTYREDVVGRANVEDTPPCQYDLLHLPPRNQ